MTLEDETGFVNVVVWKHVFDAHSGIAKTASFLGVTGHLQVQESVVHLVANQLGVQRSIAGEHSCPAETSIKHAHIGCESSQDKAEARSGTHHIRKRTIALTHDLGEHVLVGKRIALPVYALTRQPKSEASFLAYFRVFWA